jgi:glucosyl-3-phosphoglycerate synthase
VDDLLTAKGDRRVSVVIPARDEATTIGAIIAGIHADFVAATPLVDELILIDSDSTDGTREAATAAGAIVYSARDIRADLPAYAGKGEALWKSQFVTSGDVLVFIDADLTGWGTQFVSGLLGPLLTDPAVQLVKGFYDRILDDGSGQSRTQGGRVTELVARPLLNLYRPELARVAQPLAGEWAIRREAFARLSVPVGYAIEIAALLDVHARYGLDAIAQVDLGARRHRHQSVHDLAMMATEILAAVHRRTCPDLPVTEQLWQFDRAFGWQLRAVPLAERPPAADRC